MRIEALAAVLGGAQSLHTNSRDEALGLPTEESALLALRTQQIIASETGVTNTADPVGGSDEIERLTDEIERGAVDYLARIDAMGGTLRAIESGFIQSEIQNAAYEYQRAVESRRADHRGREPFPAAGTARIPTFRVDSALEQAQIERLRQLRASRDREAVERKLDRLAEGAAEHGQPDAADPGCRRGLCHRRRNLRPAQVRIRRISRGGVGRHFPYPRHGLAQAHLMHQAADVVGIVAHAESRFNGHSQARCCPAVIREAVERWRLPPSPRRALAVVRA